MKRHEMTLSQIHNMICFLLEKNPLATMWVRDVFQNGIRETIKEVIVIVQEMDYYGILHRKKQKWRKTGAML